MKKGNEQTIKCEYNQYYSKDIPRPEAELVEIAYIERS